MAKLNLKDLNKNQEKYKGLSMGIIIGVLAIFVVFLAIYVVNYSIELASSKLFEPAYLKILEFNEQTNVYSKQEYEKEITPKLDEIIAKYKSTTSGKRAYFYKGYILFYSEKYEDAQKILSYFVNNVHKNHLTEKAYYILSYCYEYLDKQDDAINILKAFDTKFKNSFYSSLIYYRLAELYQKKGDKDNAILFYKKIVDNKESTSQKESAKKQILLLTSDIKL